MAEKLIRLPQLQEFKTKADLKYQDKLIAGSNITISGNTISAQASFGQQTLYNATITAAGWSGTSNTVSIQGIVLDDDVEIVGINPTGLTDQQIQNAKAALDLITYGITSNGAITFYALGNVPNVDIPILIRKLLNTQSNVVAPTYAAPLSTGSQSILSDTLTELGNITLMPGKYAFMYTCHFGENATGYRQCGFSPNPNDLTGFGWAWADSCVAVTGATTQTRISGVFEIPSSFVNGQMFYFLAKQNSGVSLSVFPRCNYIKF